LLIRICFIGGPFCPVPGLEVQAGVSRLGGGCSPQLVVAMPRGCGWGSGACQLTAPAARAVTGRDGRSGRAVPFG
jgi:hypothetical protein